MTNSEMINKMFEKQEQLNVSIKGPNWRELNLNWNRAIFVECAELMGYLDWKWWQSKPMNKEMAEQKTMSGERVYDNANIGSYVFIIKDGNIDDILKMFEVVEKHLSNINSLI